MSTLSTTLLAATILAAATAGAQDCYRRYDTASESFNRQQIAFELQQLNHRIRIQQIQQETLNNIERERFVQETFRHIYEK